MEGRGERERPVKSVEPRPCTVASPHMAVGRRLIIFNGCEYNILLFPQTTEMSSTIDP